MEYRGQVRGGVVVFESGAPPDGTSVRVEVVGAQTQQPSDVWQRLSRLSGSATDLPEDMAQNHDHYLHGAPRK